MHIMHFTERPYKYVPEEEVIKNRSFFGVPNHFYDAEARRATSTTSISTKPFTPRKSASTRSCSTSITAIRSAWAR